MSDTTEAVTERQQYWLEHIRAADASEGSLVDYAAAHGLRVKHLYQWKTVFARRGVLPGKAKRSAFVPVAASFASVSTSSCQLTLPNGVRLQFDGEVDRGWLRELLSAASALS